jgi:hypothetical protein
MGGWRGVPTGVMHCARHTEAEASVCEEEGRERSERAAAPARERPPEWGAATKRYSLCSMSKQGSYASGRTTQQQEGAQLPEGPRLSDGPVVQRAGGKAGEARGTPASMPRRVREAHVPGLEPAAGRPTEGLWHSPRTQRRHRSPPLPRTRAAAPQSPPFPTRVALARGPHERPGPDSADTGRARARGRGRRRGRRSQSGGRERAGGLRRVRRGGALGSPTRASKRAEAFLPGRPARVGGPLSGDAGASGLTT